jgi:hypothetical protein
MKVRKGLVAVFWAIALMMEAARSSETSLSFYQTTRRYNPEDSHLHTHRRENLKSYKVRIIQCLFFALHQFSCVIVPCCYVRFEAFAAVRMMMFFWVLAPYRLVGRCQRFRETYYLHLPG